MKTAEMLPAHLQRYVVKQDYEMYTAIDQAVWRFLVRQLKQYLGEHGHECYLDGMDRTGLSTEEIPKVEEMSRALAEYGWRSVPVSGFIPPAAFMEMQALGFLPIGVVMRRLENMLYTAAPDIVHEAAGHAPIIVDPDFSAYLHRYAHIARKAIISRRDLELYKAVRELSDLKESAHATAEMIVDAEASLEQAIANIDRPSEAAILSRLHWWTVEYGLVGALDAPKIYGAGLLSSLGEARWCLQDQVQKIPFGLGCLEYSYDITEPQPQLFVSPDFETLSDVLDDLSAMMAFRVGGLESLRKVQQANTVSTVEYNSGLQVSGILEAIRLDPSSSENPAYLQFTGPVQLSHLDTELSGHGIAYHREGFGSPIGLLRGEPKCLSWMQDEELHARGIIVGQTVTLSFESGVCVQGQLTELLRKDAQVVLMSFSDCTVTMGDETLFLPEWGMYDMAVGSTIPSVFGGPADHPAYGETDDFVVTRVKPNVLNEEEQQLNALYQRVREYRRNEFVPDDASSFLEATLRRLHAEHPEDWLLSVEILECAHQMNPVPAWAAELTRSLEKRAATDEQWAGPIRDGLALA